MPTDPTEDDTILIPARMAPGEAQDHHGRIRTLVKARRRRIEFTEAGDCSHPSAIALQLCLAAAAEIRSAGETALFGPQATRLLGAQTLL